MALTGPLSSQFSRGGMSDPLIIFLDHYNDVSIPTTATGAGGRLSSVEMYLKCRSAIAERLECAMCAMCAMCAIRRSIHAPVAWIPMPQVQPASFQLNSGRSARLNSCSGFIWGRSSLPPRVAAKQGNSGTHFCKFRSPVPHFVHKRPSRFPLLLRCSRPHGAQPARRNCHLRVVRSPAVLRKS